MTNEQIRATYTMLVEYREQLFDRHRKDPLKSPPVLLLNMAMNQLLGAFKIGGKKKAHSRGH